MFVVLHICTVPSASTHSGETCMTTHSNAVARPWASKSRWIGLGTLSTTLDRRRQVRRRSHCSRERERECVCVCLCVPPRHPTIWILWHCLTLPSSQGGRVMLVLAVAEFINVMCYLIVNGKHSSIKRRRSRSTACRASQY
ncbi:hypothetical protein DM02DRAFT_271156 [Periconia macrospinosa]|uniref:Uncharacterized protein n=1 Tax=Periconia macrospinosa TaxID=97972 RepID=A0A2V1D3I9_9PLEO|nr:hypothetical protein DM02DRAFT_271156 [Periconia macrospinosa]